MFARLVGSPPDHEYTPINDPARYRHQRLVAMGLDFTPAVGLAERCGAPASAGEPGAWDPAWEAPVPIASSGNPPRFGCVCPSNPWPVRQPRVGATISVFGMPADGVTRSNILGRVRAL